MTEATVRIRQLTKIYHPSPGWMRLFVRSQIRREIVALDGIDLEVAPGEVCAIVGPNGAGKTTAFRILVGLTTPSSGEARVLGYDTHRQSVAVRREVGWMPAEDRSLFMRLTCAENLQFHGRLQGLRGNELRRRITDTLKMVNLETAINNSVFSLSAGMRARLQLARALLHQPRVLILDEPTGSIDPVAAHALMNLIISIVEGQGLAALISSHRLEDIEAIRNHVVLLHHGRILYEGNLDTLRARYERAQIEIDFRTSDAAQQAGGLIKRAELADLLSLQESQLRCALGPGVTTGDVLFHINPVMGDILHLREARVPLRDLLAEMYQRSEGDGEDHR
ncbi:MAG: ABC transporter ATP-binding protein [Acidimicrobiia bacterium]